MRVLSLAGKFALVSIAMAKTSYVTRYHYVTVDSNGNIVDTNTVLSPASEVTEATATTPSTTISSDSYISWQATTLSTIRASSASFFEFNSADLATTKSALLTEPTVEATSQTKSQVTQSIPEISTEPAPTAEYSVIQSTSVSLATNSPTESDSSVYSEIPSSGVDANFAKTILDAHNVKRGVHSASPLSWSSSLYTYAQDYANSYTCGSSLVHSGGKYGENLAYGYSTGVAALEAWYSEGVNYDYSSANVLDHFTQVIWKDTTKLGCAYKACGDGLYVICSYDPAGNFVGEELENLSAN